MNNFDATLWRRVSPLRVKYNRHSSTEIKHYWRLSDSPCPICCKYCCQIATAIPQIIYLFERAQQNLTAHSWPITYTRCVNFLSVIGSLCFLKKFSFEADIAWFNKIISLLTSVSMGTWWRTYNTWKWGYFRTRRKWINHDYYLMSQD